MIRLELSKNLHGRRYRNSQKRRIDTRTLVRYYSGTRDGVPGVFGGKDQDGEGEDVEYKGEYIKAKTVYADRQKIEVMMLLNIIKKLDGDDELIRKINKLMEHYT